MKTFSDRYGGYGTRTTSTTMKSGRIPLRLNWRIDSQKLALLSKSVWQCRQDVYANWASFISVRKRWHVKQVLRESMHGKSFLYIENWALTRSASSKCQKWKDSAGMIYPKNLAQIECPSCSWSVTSGWCDRDDIDHLPSIGAKPLCLTTRAGSHRQHLSHKKKQKRAKACFASSTFHCHTLRAKQLGLFKMYA